MGSGAGGKRSPSANLNTSFAVTPARADRSLANLLALNHSIMASSLNRDTSTSGSDSEDLRCFTPVAETYLACEKALGGMEFPDITPDNEYNRSVVCLQPECQRFFAVAKNLIEAECPGKLDGFDDLTLARTYCPTSPVPAPTTKAPAPAPTTATPTPTTKPPTTSTPTPTIPTATPKPTTTAPYPDVETIEPAPTTAVAVKPPSLTDTQIPALAPTEAPTQGSSTKSGFSTTTIAAAGGGGLIVVLVIIISVLCMRRKRRDKLDDSTTYHPQQGYDYANAATPSVNQQLAYTNVSTARTDDDTLTESDMLRGGLALAAVRIPYQNLQFGQVISQGGFGEVTRGLYNGKQVAIKRLLAARRKDPHSIRSFFKEIQLTATLDHECIVKFIGVSWDIPANLCMVSEFMVGGDLRSLLEGYKLNGHANGHDDTKLKMAVQVAHALTYLHTLPTPVVHRDLKSRNILLSSEGDAKLIDFGISCERQDVTMTAGVGTSLWMAPEVMLGQRYDEKADVFSFGVILSELDTHELPYDHARDTVSGQKIPSMVLMQLISEGKVKPRFTSMADPAMVSLAKDCLEVDPTKRPLASQVLHRIHQSRRNDRRMALDTRTAIDRGLLTLNTVASTRYGVDF